jgi:ATP-dependent protease HslVU (ClpYQ) peptidase subunit
MGDRFGRELRPRRCPRADGHREKDAEEIARKAMAIAADICVYTNTSP